MMDKYYEYSIYVWYLKIVASNAQKSDQSLEKKKKFITWYLPTLFINAKLPQIGTKLPIQTFVKSIHNFYKKIYIVLSLFSIWNLHVLHTILSKGFISKQMKQVVHLTSCVVIQSKSGMSLQTLFKVIEHRRDKNMGKIIADFIGPFQNFATSSSGKTLYFPYTI